MFRANTSTLGWLGGGLSIWRALKPACERQLAMFSAYLDESGKGHQRRSFIAIGGLVSSSLQWGRLEAEWKAQLTHLAGMPLDARGRPVPFHMSDFESGRRPVSGYQWRSEKSKRRFLNGLIDIMRRRVKLRVFCVIWLDHYHSIFPKDRRYKLPWVMCALGCASRIAKWAEEKSGDPVPFIFERGGEGWGIALDNYQRLEKVGRLGKTKIGTWTLDDKHVAGLQAADLWAWELRQHFQGQLRDGDSYTLRTSLKNIMYAVPDGAGFAIGGLELETLMEDLRLGTSTIQPITSRPDGLPKLEHGAL